MSKNKNNINEHDYSAFLGHNKPKGDIPEITKLAEEQHAKQLNVGRLEVTLKDAQEDLRELAEKRLPEKMDELGLGDYTTTTGIHVEIKEKIRGSLPVENRDKGYTWMEENGFDGLIETKVLVPFRRGELQAAQDLVEELRSRGLVVQLDRTVHHARLDGFIREQLAQGKELPLDVFGVFRQRIAKVEV